MITEEWKDIKGYEGYYQVSNLGRVRSLDRTVEYINGVTARFTGRVLQPVSTDSSGGYCSVYLRGKDREGPESIHLLVAKYFLPEQDGCIVVKHKDGNKSNNAVTNLERVRKQNARKPRMLNGVSVYEIAKKNGIAPPTVRTRLSRGWSLEDACTVSPWSDK